MHEERAKRIGKFHSEEKRKLRGGAVINIEQDREGKKSNKNTALEIPASA